VKTATMTMYQIEAIGLSAGDKQRLVSCAVSTLNEHLTFDVDAPCYQALAKLGRTAHVPAAAHAPDHDRNTVKPDAASSGEAKPRRPCGCRGRSITN
jgi:hypothetical protein